MALAARMTPVRATGITRSRRVNVVARATPEQRVGLVAATGALAAALVCSPAAMADLNRFEYNAATEFGAGTALQYGEADIDGKDFSNQDLRRSNFTAASAKKANFAHSNLQGAYFIKAVVFRANFEGANLSDTLMDRAVINEANLRQANLQRAILTRSDLGGADIYGADFTNALLDKLQQQALCRYADGVNESTGVATRKSLGCGSARRFRASTPSNPDGPQPTEDEKDAFRASLPKYFE
uniref:Thylakoid lumenal protein n=1 Tax=Chlamydomonas leiostraca TaxID=1034604 RepID=A0A7S0RK82_9CHLO